MISIARAALLTAVTVAALPAAGSAQGVLIAPTTVIVDSRSRTTSLLLVNSGDDPVEVDISSFFAYTVTDSTGQLQLHAPAQPDSGIVSAADWIRVFPRRMTIAPRAQQTVRLLVSPPAGLPDGEYWARLAVLARGGKLPITTAADTGVHVGLSIEVRTLLPVLFRKGKVSTGVAISDLRAARTGDSIVVRARLDRQGNAAMIGTVRGEVVDDRGRVRASFSQPLSAYFALEPRFSASADSVPAGRYTLRMEVLPERRDLAPESLLSFRAVRDSVAVDLP
jgi:P pilus assembly chaperone PapD